MRDGTRANRSKRGAWLVGALLLCGSAVPAMAGTRGRSKLRQLVEAAYDAKVSLQQLRPLLGTPSRTDTFTRRHMFRSPFTGVARVDVFYAWRQNREVVTRFEVLFPKGARPTAARVSRRLGIRLRRGLRRVKRTCSHGRCPRLFLPYRPRGIRKTVRLSLSLADAPGLAVSEATRRTIPRLHVEKVGFFVEGWACPHGTPLRRQVVFPAPRTARQRVLAALLRKAAAALARGNLSAAQLSALLGGRVKAVGSSRWNLIAVGPRTRALFPPGDLPWYSHNAMSRYAWLKLPLYEKRIPPMAVSGFRYVTDPRLLCRLTYHDRHLFRFRGRGLYDVYLVVELTRVAPRNRAVLRYLTLQRVPRKGVEPSF